MQKWNYKTHSYDPYKSKGTTKLVCKDLAEVIKCVACGNKLEYGDSYTSLEIHNEAGLGYSVCEDCYDLEWIRKRYYTDKN